MAANEHKNLTDINRHNPMGFENAINSTVLSKNIGTESSLSDGNLVWQKKSLMGTTNYIIQGYTESGTTNYAYGEDIKDTRSYEMIVDYGSSVVSSGSISPSNFFRVRQACVVTEVSTVTSISGWITNNNSTTVTIAICKVTPVTGNTSNVVPIVIDEVVVTGLGNNNDLVRVNETIISNTSLAAGDIILPMIKESVAGSTIYINLNIQTTTF